MKKIKNIKIATILIAVCLVFCGFSLYYESLTSALQDITPVSTTDNNRLTIHGSQIEVKQTQVHDEIEVSFTFKTLGNKYDGFSGGTYAVQWDPTQMDLVPNSFSQDASTIFNYDWTTFTVNGNPGEEGMVLIHNSGASSQEKTLRMKFTNLFKDGDFNRTAEVKVINRNEDLFVVGIVGQPLGEVATNVVINNAQINVIPINVDISGEDSVVKGSGTRYQANVTNATSGTVIWSITGQTSTRTSIDVDGVLQVGSDETAKQIQVLATCSEDTTKVASKVVQILDKNYTITNVELPFPLATANTSASKADIENIANKNKKAKVTIETNTGQTVMIEVDIRDFALPKEILDTNGNVLAGDYIISYSLNLPFITIDDMGKVVIDTSQKTNILGKQKPAMVIKIESFAISEGDTNHNNKNSQVTTNKKIDDATKRYVATSDTSSNMTRFIVIVAVSGIGCYVLYKRKEVITKK